MYYSELFQPVLSCAAHAQYLGTDPRTTAQTVIRIVADAMKTARTERPAHLDDAWFPVCVWLDEHLASSWEKVGVASTLRSRFFRGEKAQWNFYVKLDRLLAEGVSSGTRRDIAFLYYACLRLGYKGDASEAERQDALHRCRLLLEARYAEASSKPPRRKRRLAGWPARTALWLVPIGTTIAMYCAYRHFLTEWFGRL
jgi:Uncharacterized protein conserved in bacteria